jgi:hypothetical protein
VIALYTLERLGLTAALAFGLSYLMPLLVALAFAIVLQMPLAFVLFRGTRQRLSDALAVTNARRRAERERLRAALAGEPEEGSASDRPAERPAAEETTSDHRADPPA